MKKEKARWKWNLSLALVFLMICPFVVFNGISSSSSRNQNAVNSKICPVQVLLKLKLDNLGYPSFTGGAQTSKLDIVSKSQNV